MVVVVVVDVELAVVVVDVELVVVVDFEVIVKVKVVVFVDVEVVVVKVVGVVVLDVGLNHSIGFLVPSPSLHFCTPTPLFQWVRLGLGARGPSAAARIG